MFLFLPKERHSAPLMQRGCSALCVSIWAAYEWPMSGSVCRPLIECYFIVCGFQNSRKRIGGNSVGKFMKLVKWWILKCSPNSYKTYWNGAMSIFINGMEKSRGSVRARPRVPVPGRFSLCKHVWNSWVRMCLGLCATTTLCQSSLPCCPLIRA